jgi:hypothetical protein
MSAPQDKRLQDALADIVAKIRRFQGRGLGEQNTKASLIEPLLEALGWDVRNPDEVDREHRPTPKDAPVDYALLLLRKPRLLVEAKGLGEDLNDRRWIGQILGYATVAGATWCVLTDGDVFSLYNATVPVDAEEKLFCRIRLSDGDGAEALRVLNLISRSNMEENLLDVLWAAHFVDRRVKKALQEMFATLDESLLRLVRKRVPELTPKDIGDSIRRLDVRVEYSPPVQAGTAPRPRKAKAKAARERKKGRADYGVTLAEMIGVGLLKPPVRLYRKYLGTVLEATLQPDGAVEFGQVRYKTCSTAAEQARASITGRKMHTNGWSFWQYQGEGGRRCTLEEARARYLAARQGQRV